LKSTVTPQFAILKLLLSGEATTYTWATLLIHVGSAFALLVFAHFYFAEALELD